MVTLCCWVCAQLATAAGIRFLAWEGVSEELPSCRGAERLFARDEGCKTVVTPDCRPRPSADTYWGGSSNASKGSTRKTRHRFVGCRCSPHSETIRYQFRHPFFVTTPACWRHEPNLTPSVRCCCRYRYRLRWSLPTGRRKLQVARRVHGYPRRPRGARVQGCGRRRRNRDRFAAALDGYAGGWSRLQVTTFGLLVAPRRLLSFFCQAE